LSGLEGYRVIAPDLRGLGLSDAPDLGYSMPTYADDLAALLEALQVDEVVLVGLSMGGYVAFEFLRRHRERVRALVLFDTRADADSPDARRVRDQQSSLAREQGAAAIAEHMLPRMLAPGAVQSMPGVVERVRGMMLGAPVAGIAGALAAMRDRTDSTALLATLDDLPTMVVVGEEDAMTPVDLARAMASAIPGARLEVIAGAGHLPPVEAAAGVNAVLLDFLKSLPGSN
jgi:pimeloyl-ACP methyl ester carboxylesterase